MVLIRYVPMDDKNAFPVYGVTDWPAAVVHEKTATAVMWHRGVERSVSTTQG